MVAKWPLIHTAALKPVFMCVRKAFVGNTVFYAVTKYKLCCKYLFIALHQHRLVLNSQAAVPRAGHAVYWYCEVSVTEVEWGPVGAWV